MTYTSDPVYEDVDGRDKDVSKGVFPNAFSWMLTELPQLIVTVARSLHEVNAPLAILVCAAGMTTFPFVSGVIAQPALAIGRYMSISNTQRSGNIRVL